jgi:hypothetical protein
MNKDDDDFDGKAAINSFLLGLVFGPIGVVAALMEYGLKGLGVSLFGLFCLGLVCLAILAAFSS